MNLSFPIDDVLFITSLAVAAVFLYFFIFECEAHGLQDFQMYINVYFGPLCWYNTITLEKSSWRDEILHLKTKSRL